MNKVRRVLIAGLLIMSSMILSACGLSGNEDFEYMSQNSIMKISIQSTRDESYKFIVTDKDVINDIYKILSKALVVEEKSTLDPDYILEIYKSPTDIKTYSYVAGLDKKDGGNLYNSTNQYIVSNRLDNDIIRNFANIRKPINFEDMYYPSILKALDMYESEFKDVKSIGVNIGEDNLVLKFQLSTEIEEFKEGLSKAKAAKLIHVSKDISDSNVIMKVETTGFTTKKYKAIVTFENKEDNTTKEYYINNKYNEGQWNINVKEEKPEDF